MSDNLIAGTGSLPHMNMSGDEVLVDAGATIQRDMEIHFAHRGVPDCFWAAVPVIGYPAHLERVPGADIAR
jgi:hypothetical protein